MAFDVEQKPVDIMFVVPDQFRERYRRLIKVVFWSLELDKTYEVVSADDFVYTYKDMTVEEMDAALRLRCVAMVNSHDISKREWAEYKPLQEKIHNYWEAQKSAKEATP